MALFLLLASFFSLALGASRTSPPSGALVVSKSPTSGQYSSVQDAVNALSTTSTSAQAIFIEAGTYSEQVYIPARAAELTVYGSTTDTSSYESNTVTITHSASLVSGSANDDDTATLRNWAENTKIYNINVANSYGEGSQALAVSAYVGNQGYYGCQFTGYQDTVLSESGAQLFARSLIQGATDFIFGQHATAWFDAVDIRVIATSYGTVTASGRPSASDPSYYVINNSTIAAASGQDVTAGAYYLGRPWAEYARVVFQDTSMTDVIDAAGWHIWSTSEPNTADVLFGEYGNTGAGSEGTRASFASKLSGPVGISTVLGSGYSSASWVDTSYLS
ncbi:Pectinesterase 1 [Loxospora ochrophaea]|nr:Pectinesterase 1 [Loxospora ochrophaea]